MITILLLLVLFFVLDLVALRSGVDSSDGITSTEWERRQSWYLPISH